MEDGALAREQFSHALATRLQTISARRLAEKSGWGRTTVTEIKTGRQLPSAEQLEDLLTAAGADSEEIHTFQAALKRIHDVAAAPSSVATALPAIPAEPGPPSPDPGASAQGAARPRGALIRRISIGVAAAVVGAYVAAMAWRAIATSRCQGRSSAPPAHLSWESGLRLAKRAGPGPASGRGRAGSWSTAELRAARSSGSMSAAAAPRVSGGPRPALRG